MRGVPCGTERCAMDSQTLYSGTLVCSVWRTVAQRLLVCCLPAWMDRRPVLQRCAMLRAGGIMPKMGHQSALHTVSLAFVSMDTHSLLTNHSLDFGHMDYDTKR